MEKKTMTLKEFKKRKMLLILPILILPFFTLLFWALGGGKNISDERFKENKRGFNVLLPNPKFKEDSALDKMSYYDQAAIDSLKLQEQIKKDPNYTGSLFAEDSLPLSGELYIAPAIYRKEKTALNTSSFKSENEKQLYQKLEALQKAIAEPPKSIGDDDQDTREFEYGGPSGTTSQDMKSLEQMMSAMNAPAEPDPELQQLGGMLENILDIQHPERVQEKLRQSSKNQKGKVFSVSKNMEEQHITSLQVPNVIASDDSKLNSFYSLDENILNDEQGNALEAVVHETQTIVNGSIVKLRLKNDIFINGVLVPRNNFVFGTAALKGERLEVKINSIKYKNFIFPVELSVYDMDGIDGIYIPGAINRDVAKASADRSLQSLGIASLDDSWGAQAAGMGVEAAKTLLSKKVKLIKVMVKAGYEVLLYDEKEKNAN